MKHNSVAPLRSIPPIRRTLSAISIILSFVFVLAAFGVQQGTSWTYQGQLRRSGAPYNGTCNFKFSLWNAATAGVSPGEREIDNVSVVNGLFTVSLDFDNQFLGVAWWLATSVQCSGDSGFTLLDPRQPITAAPYALGLRPEAKIQGTVDGLFSALFTAQNFSASGIGIRGISAGTGPAIQGVNNNGGSAGSFTGPVDVTGALSVTAAGTQSAIFGGNNGTGLAGEFAGPVTVFGRLFVDAGVDDGIKGIGATGVHGVSNGATGTIGVLGEATGTNSVGVYGSVSGSNTAGVFGTNSSGNGIWGKSTGAGSAVYGQATSTGLAGRFTGSVVVEGNLIVQGSLFKNAGSFRIDHPLDPANKFLSHSFVESPDMKNIYDGNVTTNASGSATVTLPDYFAALNRDYRYQLTVLGQFAQAIVSRKIAGNTFEIRTDKPGVEVSWQVTGVRQDSYAKEHPIVVEEFKPAEEKGLYLYPAGFGAGEEKTIGHPSRPATAPGEREAPAAGSADQTPSK